MKKSDIKVGNRVKCTGKKATSCTIGCTYEITGRNHCGNIQLRGVVSTYTDDFLLENFDMAHNIKEKQNMNKYIQAFMDDNDLKTNEPFQIKEWVCNLRINSDSDLQVEYSEGKWGVHSGMTELLKGKLNIVKLPFKPKYGDIYWTLGEANSTEEYQWVDNISDKLRLKFGLVYRTEEEMRANRVSKIKELEGN